MTTNPTTSSRRYTVNVRLLLLTLALIALALPLCYLWYRAQDRRAALAMLERAEQLEGERDWDKAASYYQRYLLLEPDNTEALTKMAEAYSRGEMTPERTYRLVQLLYRVVGRAPDRHDLRAQLAENLLRLGNVDEAEKEAKQLLDKGPDDARTARRIMALAQFNKANGDSAAVADALKALLAAAAESPANPQLIEATACALRDFPAALPDGEEDPIARADQLIDGMIAAAPNNVDALMARYRYRTRYKLPGAADDVHAVLAIDPDHVDAILLSAVALNPATATDEQRQTAIEQLRRAVERAPTDFRTYMALARSLEQDGKVNEAIAVLTQGREAADQKFELGSALAAVCLANDKVEQAEQLITELESAKASSFVRLSASERRAAENRLLLLQGRLQHAKGDLKQSIGTLEQVLLATDTVGDRSSPQRLDAAAVLAQIHGSLGQWDKASDYWQMVIQSGSSNAELLSAAVDAMMRTGRFQEASDLIDSYAGGSRLSPLLLVQRAQALFAMQQQRPPADRNWTEFEVALERAQARASDHWQQAILNAQYRLARDDRAGAATILRDAESQFADQAEFWRQAARLYQTLSLADDQQRAIEQHAKVATSPLEQASVEVALLANESKFDAADAVLTKMIQSLEGDDRVKAQKMRIHLLRAADRHDDALAAIKSLIQVERDDTELLMLGIELALMQSDQKSADAWEAELRKVTKEGLDFRYVRARRTLQKWDELNASERTDLEREIAEIRAERPRWAPIAVLAARVAQLHGDKRQALSDYQLAIELGDRRPAAYEQVVLLLYELQRFDEAQQYIAQLAAAQIGNPVLDLLAVEIATRQDRPEKALELAKEAVDRFPNDTMRYLYWADLLGRNGKNAEALDVLRGASRRFPSDPGVWFSLMATMIRDGKPDEARSVLDGLLADSAVADEHRHALAARVYVLLGDRPRAVEQYQLAITNAPLDANLRVGYARLLAAVDQRAARTQLEQALQVDANHHDARRELAVLLASTGEEADWNRASDLLEAGKGRFGADSATDDRLRALLLSRRGRTRAERLANSQEARKILQRRMELDSNQAKDLNRLLMAQLLELEAKWSGDRALLAAADEQFQSVLDSSPGNAEYLARYIEFLLRNAQKDARGDDTSSDSDVARQREQFLDTAEKRLEELKRLPAGTVRGLDALTTAMSARILHLQGNEADARAKIAEFAERSAGEESTPNNAQRLLTNGQLFTSIGAHAEAEKWYRQLAEVSPSAYTLVVQSMFDQGKKKEAIAYCLERSGGQLTAEMATLLANVITFAEGSPEELSEALSAIQAAAKANQNNVSLMQSNGVMQASRGEYDEAIATFRRIIKLDPDNTLALNNLATLLGERPNTREEALQVIEQAIAISGRQPGLLDTQGTILLKLGRLDQAIACLEEATASDASDARYYLHLAAAYQEANRAEDARNMLAEAEVFGLKNLVLTGDDRVYLSNLGKPDAPAK